MRGAETFPESPFTVHHLDEIIPGNDLLRQMRHMVNGIKMDLKTMLR